jgi:hypothetical protein
MSSQVNPQRKAHFNPEETKVSHNPSLRAGQTEFAKAWQSLT